MRYPTAEAIVELHHEILALTGGHAGILNRGSVESAVERAEWGPFPTPPDLFDRAALLLRGLCQDHPFADGNKRTAYEAADMFLGLNGKKAEAPQDAVVTFMLAVAQDAVPVEGIAEWLRAHTKDYAEWEDME